MLVVKYYSLKRNFFFSLFLRRLILTCDFFILAQILSTPTAEMTQLRNRLKIKNTKFFLVTTASCAQLFSKKSPLGFLRAQTLLFYCTSVIDFLHLLSVVESVPSVIPFGVIFKRRLIKIPGVSLSSFSTSFDNHSKSFFILFHNLFSSFLIFSRLSYFFLLPFHLLTKVFHLLVAVFRLKTDLYKK